VKSIRGDLRAIRKSLSGAPESEHLTIETNHPTSIDGELTVNGTPETNPSGTPSAPDSDDEDEFGF